LLCHAITAWCRLHDVAIVDIFWLQCVVFSDRLVHSSMEYGAKQMNKTPQKKLDRNRYKRLRRKYWVNLYKTSKGCAVCGYNASPYALDFDHVDGVDKLGNPSRMFLYTLKKLMGEIKKCRVLCRNCHGIHTAHEALKLHGLANQIIGER